MYQPKKYKKQDPAYLFEFIKQHPFASFILKGERLLATHIPVLIEGNSQNFRLYAHIANHNEQLQYLKDDAEALMIFQGAHGYISSSWYQEKDISTWDYSAVHVNVKLKLQTREELVSSLDNLVQEFEKDQTQPLYYKDIPKQMLEDHLPLITGFWAEPFKIEGVAKLHQSYKKEDVNAVIHNLNEGDALSKELSKNIREENNGNY
ncbi:PaiB family negative transcriptional regulator [Gillisia mitskevichiae]|uniref:PaiB family negative transcriptional regulator n=1 Tax=Gillisia mitskevichiae TaxID=270921 RepID=A0A495PVC0_9FLAO|nr:FMN-binding negative transcriptional regulator [Gillisia mitskevichiae]RKS55135.1 PaiB family negative transcriptional regulator [Gillisia mitskevichiae]